MLEASILEEGVGFGLSITNLAVRGGKSPSELAGRARVMRKPNGLEFMGIRVLSYYLKTRELQRIRLVVLSDPRLLVVVVGF
jgi:hypothetical protein